MSVSMAVSGITATEAACCGRIGVARVVLGGCTMLRANELAYSRGGDRYDTAKRRQGQVSIKWFFNN
jgi:hypothetical protein